MKDEQSLELRYANLLFNRRLLVFAHSLLGFLLALSYLTTLHLGGFRYWQASGITILLLAAPVLLPLVVSAAYSRQVTSHHRLPIYVFISVVVICSAATMLVYAGSFEIKPNGLQVMILTVVQTLIYIGFAKLLLK